MKALLEWFDHRTGIKDLMREALYERVPGGARWRYVWGSTLVFTFVLQVITGFMLWAAYSPSTRTAWESVFYIQNEMTFGYLVRGIHHFAAQAMVVLMAIHLVQVVIDGAYKAPREMNFWLGIVLMQIVLGLALTGYLLPWDQKGYYATQVTTNIMSNTPGVGEQVQTLAQGGKDYGHLTLTRFFAMHAGILPALLVGFLALHLFLFRRHGLTVHDVNHAPETTFWPDQVLKDAIACLIVLAVVLLLAFFRGAELSAPADPATKFDAARPEWYFLFLFEFLHIPAINRLGVTIGAIVIPGIIMGLVTLMPLIHKFFGERGHKFNKTFIWLLSAGIVVLTLMAIIKDNGDEGHQAAMAETHRDGQRARELALGPDRIPVEGAISLMRQDPFTQGPRVFEEKCSGCHRYNGHDGRGSMVVEGGKTAPPTAADLGNFGSREWMRSVVVDYSDHFRWLKNAKWYKDAQVAGEDVLDPDTSEMADWSGDAEALKSDENGDVKALVEFLYAEADHGYKGYAEDEEVPGDIDARLVAKGREGLMNDCKGCHWNIGDKFVAFPDEEFAKLAEENGEYPALAKYASEAWLKDFIRNPGAARHYGAKNQMPASSVEDLSDEKLDLLVRWMTGNYLPSTVSDYDNKIETLTEAIASPGEAGEKPADEKPGKE